MKGKSLAIALLALAPLVASASDRKDAELALTEASTAVDSAGRADAAQYATTDFGTAQDMLTNAHVAFDSRNWTDSVIDSQNAKADANLAAARCRQKRAEATTAELERTVRSLREQVGITSGGQP